MNIISNQRPRFTVIRAPDLTLKTFSDCRLEGILLQSNETRGIHLTLQVQTWTTEAGSTAHLCGWWCWFSSAVYTSVLPSSTGRLTWRSDTLTDGRIKLWAVYVNVVCSVWTLSWNRLLDWWCFQTRILWHARTILRSPPVKSHGLPWSKKEIVRIPKRSRPPNARERLQWLFTT